MLITVRKPVQLEAILFKDNTPVSIKNVLEFLGDRVDTEHPGAQNHFEKYCDIVKRNGIEVHTLSGTGIAKPGNYVVKYPSGFNVFSAEDFNDTYIEIKQPTHDWDWKNGGGTTCVKCGDKDWMADAVCSESKLISN